MSQRFSHNSVKKLWTSLGQNVENINSIKCVLIPRYGCRIKLKLNLPIHHNSLSITNNFLVSDDVPYNNDLIDLCVFHVSIKK